MAAATFTSNVLRLFYGGVTQAENRILPLASAEPPTLSKAIQNLPPELRERILKEYLAIKMRERADLGWDEAHVAILEAPFCEEREPIVKVLFCSKFHICGRDGLCFHVFQKWSLSRLTFA